MSKIDPEAVFISDAGEVLVSAEDMGRSAVFQLNEPSGDAVEAVPYETIHFLPERARVAICRLLQEREAQDLLLDRCAEALLSLAFHGAPRLVDPRLDALINEINQRDLRKRFGSR